jgi:hypothetical protein
MKQFSFHATLIADNLLPQFTCIHQENGAAEHIVILLGPTQLAGQLVPVVFGSNGISSPIKKDGE